MPTPLRHFARLGLAGLILSMGPVGLAGCAHAGGAVASSAQGPADPIDVSPGRDPEAVRAVLRHAAEGIAAFAVRIGRDLPARTDARTRVHFVIEANGAIRTQVPGPYGELNDPKFYVESVVLEPHLARRYIARRAAFPPAPVDVEVSYTFRVTPDWFATQRSVHQRVASAIQEACTAFSAPAGQVQAKLDAAGAWSKLPMTPENAGRVRVGQLFKVVASVDPSDRLNVIGRGFCDIGGIDFPKLCPALFSGMTMGPEVCGPQRLDVGRAL